MHRFRLEPLPQAAHGWNFLRVRRKVERQRLASQKEVAMNYAGKLLTIGALLLLAAALLVFPQFAATKTQQQTPGTDHSAQTPGEAVPVFHARPPEGKFPPTCRRRSTQTSWFS